MPISSKREGSLGEKGRGVWKGKSVQIMISAPNGPEAKGSREKGVGENPERTKSS